MKPTPKIKRVQVLPEYKLEVTFEKKIKKIFDVRPYLKKGIFSELQNFAYFKKVRVVSGGVEWPHEQDFSADTLFHLSVKKKNQ